jgi:hypothetical protein
VARQVDCALSAGQSAFGQDNSPRLDYDAPVIESADRTEVRRHVWLTLAALAVMLKVLIPAGFMPGPVTGANFPLVLCTGHGVVATNMAEVQGKKAPADKPASDAPCVFAGHGTAAPASDLSPLGFVAFSPEPAAVALPPRDGLAPGRGLAAPPPPSRGPPTILI